MGLKPNSSHRAELVLFVFLVLGLVFQVGLARMETDSVLFRGRTAFEKRCLFALGQVRGLGTKARHIWLSRRERLAKLLPKDARTLNAAAGEQLRPWACHKETDEFLGPA